MERDAAADAAPSGGPLRLVAGSYSFAGDVTSDGWAIYFHGPDQAVSYDAVSIGGGEPEHLFTGPFSAEYYEPLAVSGKTALLYEPAGSTLQLLAWTHATGAHLLSSSTTFYTQPAVSLDGTAVAHFDHVDLGTGRYDLTVWNTEGPNVTAQTTVVTGLKVLSDGCPLPRWQLTSGGDLLALLCAPADADGGAPQGELWLYRAPYYLGKRLEAGVAAAAFSPSGSWALATLAANPNEAHLIHVPDGATTVVGESASAPWFDRAESAAYWIGGLGSVERVSLADPTAAPTTLVKSHVGSIVAQSPDGGWLLLAARAGGQPLIASSRALGVPQPLPASALPALDPFTTDSAYALYEEVEDAGASPTLFALPLAGGAPIRVAEGVVIARRSIGGHVLVVDQRFDLVDFDPSGAAPPRTIASGLTRPGGVSLTPDGAHVVYAAADGLYVAPL